MGIFDVMAGGGLQNASTMTKVSSGALQFGIMLFVMLIIGAILAFAVWMYLRYKQYTEFKCIIYERDGFGQLKQTEDAAGIFVDKKTNNKRLYLKKGQVGLNPDAVPYVATAKGKKIIYFLKTGLKNYHFINLNIEDTNIHISVGEEDVNWAINSYERQKKMFSQSMLMQLLPFMALAFTGIIILIIFIYFFKEFKVLGLVAEQMKETATILMQGQGTTVITGG